ncbi:uncharacterized protein LOC131687064 [Topomyia yanbarensis]|uniref:uncharacterized protein LOC131687064 n=1 Tax=Topomyia yanbarensis TaxID=2498891 RepID=UPI00273CB58C|nr:uncharacterized protein LOC131687064 [Topomyia yanbarensis]
MAPPKGGGRKKKPNDLLPKLEGHREGPKFIILKRVDGSFEKVSPIIIHKGIKTICGEPLNTIKLRDGTLLVKTKNINQANQLLRCKMMFEMEITVEENIKLNQTKGIVTCADLKYATEEEILEELQEQGVCNVEVMKRKKDGILISTNSYILTFKSNGIPESVKVGYLVLSVRLFIPRPLRCYKCQYFGHSSKFCSKEEVCSNCCKVGHTSDHCSGGTLCRNCGSSEHASWSLKCKVFETEQEITRIKVTENVSVREARQLYKIRFPNHTSTYSEVVSNIQEKNSNLKCTDDMPVVPSLNPLLPLQQMDTQSASTSTMDSGPVVDDNNRATSMDYQIAKISRPLSPDTGDLNEYENDIKRMRNTQSSLSGSSIVSADGASLSSNGL